MATHVNRKTFLRNLEQSGLLSAQDIVDAVAYLPESNRGRVLARALVKRGLLTRFQAELLLAGRTSGFLLGQYRILDELGQGGMGRVFKAVHLTMNRTVALKLLAPQLVNTAKAKELFQSEVRAAARLMHPNIVTAYDANQIGDRHYLVMEFVDGPNLDQLVRNNAPLPAGLACEIIRQTANGLQYAHDMGMVHRDIKPANLLVHRAGKNKALVVKILDFGLARLHEPGRDSDGPDTNRSSDRKVMGTPDFLSPEQSHGQNDVDIRSDLYSLGCTFYFLLTGRVPFPKGTSVEKLLRHRTEEPSAVEQDRPDLPTAVVAIVRRLMAKDPADRFQTPAELAAALAAFADAETPAWTFSRKLSSQKPSDWHLPSTGDLDLDKASDVPAPSDVAGMVGTLPPDFAPTPSSSLNMAADLGPQDHEIRRQARTLFWALGIVAGVAGLVVLLVLLIRG